MCSEMPHELFHPTCKTPSANMPLTKVDDAERKRQGRVSSPSERGRRCERAPWSQARNAERMRQERAPSLTSSADSTGQPPSKKARDPWSKASDADRKRQERAPSPTFSADATGQALSKKARALARIRPFVHSFAASISAPAPAQQLKCQPLAFDDSSREAATASGLAIVKVFFENRNMNRSCAFAHGSLGSTLCLLCRSHRQHQKVLFVRGPFVGRDSFGSRRCGRQGTWKTYSLASFELPIYQGVPAPLSLSPALLSSLVQALPKCSSPTCFVAHVLHRASTSFEVWLDLEVLPWSSEKCPARSRPRRGPPPRRPKAQRFLLGPTRQGPRATRRQPPP